MEKYVRLLNLFADTHGQDEDRLRQMLAASDRAGMDGLAHAIKGAAGNLGAGGVMEAAAALQRAVHEGDGTELARCAEHLAEVLGSLIRAIRKAIAAQVVPAAAVDSSRAWSVLTQMRAMLESGNFAVHELVLRERATLLTALGPSGGDVLRCIEVFDYESALARLRELDIPG